jgi:hypothetical protein
MRHENIWLGGHESQPDTVCNLAIFSFPSPEGGEKTRLGGELRREEQLLTRTGMCMDRDGIVDDVSEGVFHPPSPPSSGTTGVAHEQRSSRSASISTS